MPTAGIAQLKARLSEYVARVKRGEEVLITERGKLVARMVPVEPAETDEEARIQRLVAKGLARLPMGKLDVQTFLAQMPVIDVPEGTLSRALEEDREDRV